MQRGLKPSTITFLVWDLHLILVFALVNQIIERKITDEELAQANVAMKNPFGKAYGPLFSSRDVFYYRFKGKCDCVYGRTMTDQKPKYLNTSDILAFKKSYGLFAMNFAKNSGKEQLTGRRIYGRHCIASSWF